MAGESTTRGWRIGHVGRDDLFYEEKVAGRWERLTISGEMLSGTPDHVIYFDSASKWKGYPAWARDRRTEIIQRIKVACPTPKYEHKGEFEHGGVERFLRHTVTITRPAGSKLYIEPWATEYEAKPGETWEVELKGPECGCESELVVENEQETITVWGWTGCTYKVFRNGQLVDHSSNRVPEVPNHTHPQFEERAALRQKPSPVRRFLRSLGLGPDDQGSP